jgi:hypothetical protein
MAKTVVIPEVEERFWDRIKEMALLGQDTGMLGDVADAVEEGDRGVDEVADMLAAGGEAIEAVRVQLADFLGHLSEALRQWAALRAGRGPEFRAALGALLQHGWMKPWLGEEATPAEVGGPR